MTTTNWTSLETSPSIDTEIYAVDVACYVLYALSAAFAVAAAINALVHYTRKRCKKQNKAIFAVDVTSACVEHETNGIVNAVVVEVPDVGPEKQEDFS